MSDKTTPVTTTKNFATNVNSLSGIRFGSINVKRASQKAGKHIKRGCIASIFLMTLITLISMASVVILIIFVIMIVSITNSSGFVTPHAPSLLAYFDPSGGFENPTGCPLTGGVISLGSYNPTQEQNREGGHGSYYYWNDVYSFPCYSIPQTTGCRKSIPADSSRCNNPDITGTACTEYGYAADVFSSNTEVVLPLVNGESRDWTCTYGFPNGSVGNTIYCSTTSGSPSVRLVLTHVVASPGFSRSGPSGTIVTNLFDQGWNTHLHLEAQIDGVWVRPENYFCGGG